jgi:hypothetical protein
MVFERLLVEISCETNGGFAADYVKIGENAQAILDGSRRFYVEFPKAAVATSSRSKAKKPAAKKKSTRKKAASKTKRKSTSDASENGLVFEEIGDSDDDDPLLHAEPFGNTSKQFEDSLLDANQTKNLEKFIKKLTNIWAQEEQIMGKNVHCKYSLYVLLRKIPSWTKILPF